MIIFEVVGWTNCKLIHIFDFHFARIYRGYYAIRNATLGIQCNMTSNQTSFQRKQAGKFIKLKGTKPSLHNAQLLISTGVPSLDHICGGGIPVGSVFLVEEDKYNKYAKLLLKYYLAEGITSEHDLMIASCDVRPSNILKELPGLIDGSEKNQADHVSSSDQMKIAWRYQKMDAVKSSVDTSSFGHYYDLSRTLDQTLIDRVRINSFDGLDDGDENVELPTLLVKLLMDVENLIKRNGFSIESAKTDSSQDKKVLRISISSIGSCLWGARSGESLRCLPLFLLKLKAIVRSSLAVAFVTIPSEILNATDGVDCVRRIEWIADNVIRLESFIGSEKAQNPLYKDYHGLFHIRKFSRINSLCCHVPSTFDLAFKLKRKSFAIETLHLPPDLSETVSRSSQSIPSSGSACSTSLAKRGIDF